MKNDLEQPLLKDECLVGEPSAPPLGQMQDSAPSAPTMLSIMSDKEFQVLKRELAPGSSEWPEPEQLKKFRVATCHRLLWTLQARELATTVDGGKQMFREAYERQLLADPNNLLASDGSWVPGQVTSYAQLDNASQALATALTVIHHDGRFVQVAVDLASSTVGQALQLAAEKFGESFDEKKHCVFGGASASATLQVSSFVKITELLRGALNGHVGQIVGQEGDSYAVTTSAGVHSLHKDNVIPYNATVVARSHGHRLETQHSLSALGIVADAKLLWLETGSGPSMKKTGQPLDAIKSQFFGMDVAGDHRVAAGEFRNFLWNLHLSDSEFDTVRKRFCSGDSGGDYICLNDMLFLLGRPHLLSPEVPVDALVYEAVVSILGRRTTAHIDRSLAEDSTGIGTEAACNEHCGDYTVSLCLQGIVFVCLVLFVLPGSCQKHRTETNCDYGQDGYGKIYYRCSEERLVQYRAAGGECVQYQFGAVVAYFLYIVHLIWCVDLTSSFRNLTEGIEAVMGLMDQPRHENPHYAWQVQCYHFETRTRYSQDANGNRTTSQEQVTVNTHSARASGIIPSTDHTPTFVPETVAQQTQLDTHLDLDFSSSNYMAEFGRWCAFHRRDTHQSKSHTEKLPSRKESCLAVWLPRSTPWWMNENFYWLANICLMSCAYRLMVQRVLGHQEYTYHKKCFNINRGPF